MTSTKKKLITLSIMFLLLWGGSLLMLSQEGKETNSCFASGCHKELKKKTMHPPANDDCTTCHESTNSNHPANPGKDFKLTSNVPDLCTTCHDLKKGTKSEHSPVASGECMTCHNPHGTDTKKLLNTNDGKSICTMCHDFSGKDLNVHAPVRNGECTKCHEPHNSAHPNLLKDDENALCQNCHNKAIKVKDRTLANIKQKTTSKYVHQPIIDQSCTICHNSHASKNDALLLFEYHRTTYVFSKDKSFGLCFSCHSEEMISDKLKATRFNNGTINLHFVHVNREKSRNCDICHDMHGSNEPFMMNKSVPYNKWILPINFTKLEHGGKCASGCHKEVTYESSVDIQKQMVEAKPGIVEQDTSGTLYCQIMLNPGFNQNNIKHLTFYLNRTDTLHSQTIEVIKRLNFTVKNLPKGDYVLSVDKKDMESINATTNTQEQKFRISGGSLINNANLKFYLTIKGKKK